MADEDYRRQYAAAFDEIPSSDEAFHAAITAKPEDQLPSLVYADWLDDHGKHAHAEVIRRHFDDPAAEPPMKEAYYRHALPTKRGDTLVFSGEGSSAAFPAPHGATGRWVSVAFPNNKTLTQLRFTASNLSHADQWRLVQQLRNDENAKSYGYHAAFLLQPPADSTE